MKNIEGKVVAITGASSGIGEATARLLAGYGAKVVAGARRVDRLHELAKEIPDGRIEPCAVDVTKREDVQRFIDHTCRLFGRLDVLINNAGVMPLSPFAALRVEEWEQTLDVNVRGVLYGIAAALPVMLAQGEGQFINVSSIAGHAVFPSSGVYCASKFAVNAISEALRQEHDRIRVTIVSPGATESELAETTRESGAREFLRVYRQIIIPARAIADAIAFAIAQPAHVDVSELIVRPTASVG